MGSLARLFGIVAFLMLCAGVCFADDRGPRWASNTNVQFGAWRYHAFVQLASPGFIESNHVLAIASSSEVVGSNVLAIVYERDVTKPDGWKAVAWNHRSRRDVAKSIMAEYKLYNEDEVFRYFGVVPADDGAPLVEIEPRAFINGLYADDPLNFALMADTNRDYIIEALTDLGYSSADEYLDRTAPGIRAYRNSVFDWLTSRALRDYPWRVEDGLQFVPGVLPNPDTIDLTPPLPPQAPATSDPNWGPGITRFSFSTTEWAGETFCGAWAPVESALVGPTSISLTGGGGIGAGPVIVEGEVNGGATVELSVTGTRCCKRFCKRVEMMTKWVLFEERRPDGSLRWVATPQYGYRGWRWYERCCILGISVPCQPLPGGCVPKRGGETFDGGEPDYYDELGDPSPNVVPAPPLPEGQPIQIWPIP